MGSDSKIEWTDATFNPWIGCTRVSAGCEHCYAEQMMDARYGRVKWGPKGERSVTSDAYWRQPLTWNRKAAAEGRRLRVFCASLSDVFDDHPSISKEWRSGLWNLIADTQNLDWLLLTKRPQNWPKFMPIGARQYPFENIRLGITIEDQATADKRFPLMQVARLGGWPTFVSYEPALGAIDWQNMLTTGTVDWLIAGGESGKEARPSHPQWFRDARDACARHGVAYLFKQFGEWFGPISAVPGGDMGGDMRRDQVRIVKPAGDNDGHFRRGDVLMRRVGKKAAGRLLDGVEHNGFPTEQRR